MTMEGKLGLLFLDVWVEVCERRYLHEPRVGDISESSHEGVLVEGRRLRSNCQIDILSIGTVSIDANVHNSNTQGTISF